LPLSNRLPCLPQNIAQRGDGGLVELAHRAPNDRQIAERGRNDGVAIEWVLRYPVVLKGRQGPVLRCQFEMVCIR
jgi:hypothetical protein